VLERLDSGEDDVIVLPGRKIATPESIQQKMNDLTKPGPPRAKEFFIGLGLSGLGSNPHR
jgi:hypothetical protein